MQEKPKPGASLGPPLLALKYMNDRTLMKLRAVTSGHTTKEQVKATRFDFTPLGAGVEQPRTRLVGKRGAPNQDLAEVQEIANRLKSMTPEQPSRMRSNLSAPPRPVFTTQRTESSPCRGGRARHASSPRGRLLDDLARRRQKLHSRGRGVTSQSVYQDMS